MIRVRRANDDIAGRFRRITVTLDGSTVARLRRGESTTIEVAPGTHELCGRMDWVRTQPTILNGDGGGTFEFSLPFSIRGLGRKGMQLRRL
jgi:hypothetical protein